MRKTNQDPTEKENLCSWAYGSVRKCKCKEPSEGIITSYSRMSTSCLEIVRQAGGVIPSPCSGSLLGLKMCGQTEAVQAVPREAPPDVCLFFLSAALANTPPGRCCFPDHLPFYIYNPAQLVFLTFFPFILASYLAVCISREDVRRCDPTPLEDQSSSSCCSHLDVRGGHEETFWSHDITVCAPLLLDCVSWRWFSWRNCFSIFFLVFQYFTVALTLFLINSTRKLKIPKLFASIVHLLQDSESCCAWVEWAIPNPPLIMKQL